MQVTDEQVDSFRDHGYVIVPGFFDDREVAALQAETQRFRREGLLRNVATEGDGRTHSTAKANLQLLPLSNKSSLFRALPFAPHVLASVSRLIGDPYLLHLDQMFLKPAGHGMGTNWHVDNAYFKVADPLAGTAMWIAVHDATVANGTLHIIPDSHKESYEHERDPHSDHHVRCFPPEDRALACELEAGGVVFFCYGIAHATKANETDADRAGVGIHFLRADYVTPEVSLQAGMPHPLLTGPEASGGLAEYGTTVAGTWDGEVERILAGASR